MRILVTSLALLGACSKPPEPQPSQADKATAAAAPAPDADAKAQAAPAPKPLSEADKRLIAMDPAELTPDMRRKRAYALRRKAMQNPDSAVARTLNDLEDAYHRGELEPPNRASMPTFTVDGKAPSGGAPPAGARPAETPAK